jgi:uncharacterized protein YbbC (DUF1343 family)
MSDPDRIPQATPTPRSQSSQMAQPAASSLKMGLERVLDDQSALLQGRRFGLLLNQASVDRFGRLACDGLAERFPGQLQALFSPQHGLWGEQQANMIESGHDRYPPLDLPIYSLYSATRRPTQDMLRDLDAFVIDLQDVGTRIYTFIWTMQQCLLACDEIGLPIIILDRPNPLGGVVSEGPMLVDQYRSFVGNATIPMRHALTIGELARLFHAEAKLTVELTVVPMTGWQRHHLFPEWRRPWSALSPNMQRWETAVVYPGQVLLEGTNLSEGRGTTLPFEMVGAPFLDPWQFTEALLQLGPFPGLILRPTRFVPTFDKHRGERCGGVLLQVTDAQAVRSVDMTVCLLQAAREQAPSAFRWLSPPYEYETIKPPIDILFGSDRLRRGLDAGQFADVRAKIWSAEQAAAWSMRTAPIRLYS